jgi:hypothetical protein
MNEKNNIQENEILEKTSEKPKEQDHNQNDFQKLIEYGFKSGGAHVVGSKGHGKSRLMFSIARELRRFSKLYIFDGSETWLYAYDRIPTFTVKEQDIRLLGRNNTVDEIENYMINNFEQVKKALNNYPALLFRLKTRKPSKRGFFIRQVVNYLDTRQREARQTTKDNEALNCVSYIIEEAQNAFNSRSTTRLEAEEFLSVFNEARNQREAFFTASQRLTDFSKTIRTKQSYIFGRVNEEDKGSNIRRIEKLHKVDLCRLPQKTWFIEGLEKKFTSPDWKQSGKPFQINNEVKTDWKTSYELAKLQKQAPFHTRFLRRLFRTKTTKYIVVGHDKLQAEEDEKQEIEDEETEDYIFLAEDEEGE